MLKLSIPKLKNILSKIKARSWHQVLLWLILIIPYVLLAITFFNYRSKIRKIAEAKIILVDKGESILSVVSYNGEIIHQYNIATGSNYGDKEEQGDLKTPEGIFQIVSIQNASEWEYDFEDDTLPAILGAYGPYFLRLSSEFKGIGIHGTHDNNSLSKRSSHGCIRMNNSDLLELIDDINIGTSVIIIPSKEDL